MVIRQLNSYYCTRSIIKLRSVSLFPYSVFTFSFSQEWLGSSACTASANITFRAANKDKFAKSTSGTVTNGGGARSGQLTARDHTLSARRLSRSHVTRSLTKKLEDGE